jgi:hypothetical protein
MDKDYIDEHHEEIIEIANEVSAFLKEKKYDGGVLVTGAFVYCIACLKLSNIDEKQAIKLMKSLWKGFSTMAPDPKE